MAVNPNVFVSATTADLGSCRLLVKEALLTLRCRPVEQTNFAPDSHTVEEMLRAKIRDCCAVIHLVGVVYGAEPSHRVDGVPRRSYSQLELDIAHALGKRTYVFICDDGFPYDKHEPEEPEKQRLQLINRTALKNHTYLYTLISSREQLEKRIRELDLRPNLALSCMGWGLAVSLTIAALFFIAAMKSQIIIPPVRDDLAIAEEREFSGNVKTILLADLQNQALSSEDWSNFNLEKSIEVFAQTSGQPSKAVKDLVDRRIHANLSSTDPVKRAEAEFLSRNFADASTHFDEIATNELKDGESGLEKAAEHYSLSGLALINAGRQDMAYERFEKASRYTSRQRNEKSWAARQVLVGVCGTYLGVRVEPHAGNTYLSNALIAYRAALEVYTKDTSPLDWAMTQNGLGFVLRQIGSRTEARNRRKKFEEALIAIRLALTVYTRQHSPMNWVRSQRNFAAVLSHLADDERSNRTLLLYDEAIAINRAALEVATPETMPLDWARTKHNLASDLKQKAHQLQGTTEATLLLGEAMAASRMAELVLSQERLPEDWAKVHSGLAHGLCDMAKQVQGEERLRLLGQAKFAFDEVLKVYTRSKLPQDWASTQYSMGQVFMDQAAASTRTERTRLYGEAIVAFQLALEIRTREDLPNEWASTQYSLGSAFFERARLSNEVEAVGLYSKAVDSYKNALEVQTKEDLPVSNDIAQKQLLQAEAALAKLKAKQR